MPHGRGCTHITGWKNAEELAIPESWKGVKVRAAPYKAADPPGWNPPGSLTCAGEAGGALGRQTVPASKAISACATHARLYYHLTNAAPLCCASNRSGLATVTSQVSCMRAVANFPAAAVLHTHSQHATPGFVAAHDGRASCAKRCLWVWQHALPAVAPAVQPQSRLPQIKLFYVNLRTSTCPAPPLNVSFPSKIVGCWVAEDFGTSRIQGENTSMMHSR